MVTIRVLIMLLAAAGLEDPSAADWQVYTTTAHPTIASDGAVWWVTADAPGQLMCDRGDRVESFPLEPARLSAQSLWYLADDSKGRIWLFSNPLSPRTAVFDHGTWRAFDTLETAFGTVAREEKGNTAFRIGNPRQQFYPAFAGDGRVTYRELNRIAHFDGTRWDRETGGGFSAPTDVPPFYVDGVLTIRIGRDQYLQFREKQWQPPTQSVACPYEDMPTSSDNPPMPGRRRRVSSPPGSGPQSIRLRDNVGTTWMGKVPDLFRTMGDMEVQFPTAGSPLSPEDRISEVFADVSGRTWFVLSGERWLTGTGDYERLIRCAPKQSPPEIEWSRTPPELVKSGSVSGSIRIENVSGGSIVRYQCQDDSWQQITSKGSSCEILLGYPVDGVYTLRVQAFDGMLRPSRELTHTFKVERDYEAEAVTLVQLLGAADLNEREMAARALVKIGKSVVPALERSLKDADADRRWWIQAVLDEIRSVDDK